MAQAVIFIVFPLCLAIAAFSDLLSMTIPNRVSAILLAAFFLVAPLAGLSIAEIGVHVLTGLAVFAACFTLFALNVMGGGDAKLLTASAVWFGFTFSLVEFLVSVCFFGGLLTLCLLAFRPYAAAASAYGISLPAHLVSAKSVPYGIAIGLAAFATYPSSPLMIAALSIGG